MILCDDTEVIDSRSYHCLANQATFMQMEIPATAKFLTLVTAAANASIGCDHGTFAEARITAEPVDGSVKELSLVNFPGILAGGTPLQLELITELNAYGALVSPNIEDFEFASGNEEIIEVSPEGMLTPQDVGDASFSIKYGDVTITRQVLVGIDLGGMAAGSNGFEMPDPAVIGINQDTGQWASARTPTGITDVNQVNPEPVIDSPFINCVFLLNMDDMAINLTDELEPGLIYSFATAYIPEFSLFILFLPVAIILSIRPHGLFGAKV